MQMFDFSWKHQKYARPEIYVVNYVESPIFNAKQFFITFSHFSSGIRVGKYIHILMMRFYTLLSHYTLCKTLRVSDSKYGHQRTNSTIGSNRFQVGS